MALSDELNRLYMRRKLLKRTYGIIKAKVEDDSQKSELHLNLSILREHFNKITEVYAAIEDVMLNMKFQEDDLFAEADSLLQITTEHERIVRDYTKVRCTDQNRKHGSVESLAGLQDQNESSGGYRGDSQQYRLPRLELIQFDICPKNWIEFFSEIQQFHNNDILSEEIKFRYLIQCIKKGTPGEKIVNRFRTSLNSYSNAIKALKQRFGRDDLIVNVYVRELIDIMLRPDKPSLADIYDHVSAQINALESFGFKIEMFSLFLAPMVENALPQDVLLQYERIKAAKEMSVESSSLSIDETNVIVNPLSDLLRFLETEVHSLQKVKLSNLGSQCATHEDSVDPKMTASALLTKENTRSSRERACLFCTKPHVEERCAIAQNMSVDERRKVVLQKRACFGCLLPFHGVRDCRSRNIICLFCSQKHSSLLCHLPRETNKRSESNQLNKEKSTENIDTGKSESQSTAKEGENKEAKLACSASVGNPIHHLLTLEVKIGKHTARALCDSGSEFSYILESKAKDIGLSPNDTIQLSHCLFGGQITGSEVYNTYDVELGCEENNYKGRFQLIGVKNICQSKAKPLSKELMRELNVKGVKLSDRGVVDEVEILLGSTALSCILTGDMKKLESGPLLVKTVFGFTMLGAENKSLEKHGSSLAMATLSLLTTKTVSADVNRLWDLDVLNIHDHHAHKSKIQHDEEVLQSIFHNITREEDGRYKTRLSWKGNVNELANNKMEAFRRLQAVTKKLKDDSLYEKYDAVLQDWKETGVIEKVCDQNFVDGYYLPHRPVLKPDSVSTPIRPVFDASSADPSLNSLLESGPNMTARVPEIISRFRCGKIGVSSDISKAFLNLTVHEEDRDYLKFLWWNDAGEVEILRHVRLVFGLRCSPSLLNAVLLHHLQAVNIHTETLTKLKGSFYVDNSLVAVDSIEEYERFKEEASEICRLAKFDLRQWARSKVPGETDRLGDTMVLGLVWNRDDDTLRCRVPEISMEEAITKRRVLSILASVFDVMGYWCAVLIPPKLILREAWKRNLLWDDPLPDDLKHAFNSWVKTLPMLEKCRIPRFLYCDVDLDHLQFHVFVDSSQNAYSACIFLRVEGIPVRVTIVEARSRLAPTEKMSIPRLELTANLIGARLMKSVQTQLHLEHVPVTFWTDSTVALCWIQSNAEMWNPYVKNRVKEIAELFDIRNWRLVPGELNIADLPSRGCDAAQFLKSSWWEGPTWLKQPKNEWPKTEFDGMNEERRTVQVLMNKTQVEDQDDFVLSGKRCSNFMRIVRAVAYMLRWKARMKENTAMGKQLSGSELHAAEMKIYCNVQRYMSVPENVEVKVDDEGIKRISTRLSEKAGPLELYNPIILPGDHIIVRRLIEYEHQRNSHAGVLTLVSILRKRVWITKARCNVKKVVTACGKCKRFSAKNAVAKEAALPIQRTNEEKCFRSCGVDLMGPVFLKDGGKAWIVIFTCAMFRAIHLDMVENLTTEMFKNCLRRAVSRVGKIEHMFSDRGSNLMGFENELNAIDWDEIEEFAGCNRITWHHQVPGAPTWTGFVERLVAVVKQTLKRALGKAYLSSSELYTCVCEAEAVINQRPLTYLSEDPNEVTALTPALFMHGNDCLMPELDVIDSRTLNSRARYIQTIRENLRIRFQEEYLSTLKQRSQDLTRPLKKGEVVLIETDGKRGTWPLGRIVDYVPSRDGIKRAMKLRTAKGFIERPVGKLYPLEIDSPVDDVDHSIFANVKKSLHPTQNDDTESNNAIDCPGYSSSNEKSDLVQGTEEESDDCQPLVDRDIVTRSGRHVKRPTVFDL